MEIAQGIHRIESPLGVRSMAQYVLAGTERSLLVDTGMPDTPRAVLAPYFDSAGLGLDSIHDVLVSHADNDHSGGKAALRELVPAARFACHELDRRWIESAEAMVSENYLWHAPYGFDEPDAEARAELEASCGDDVPIDIGLRGGETFYLGGGWRIEVLHLPGHTRGHLGIWDPRSRAAIVIDAVLDRGIHSRDGELLIPPRIYDLAAYRETHARLRALEPDQLLTAHWPVLDAAAARDFLDDSLEFTHELESAVGEEIATGTHGLRELTDRMHEHFGPYPEFPNELAAAVRAAAAL